MSKANGYEDQFTETHLRVRLGQIRHSQSEVFASKYDEWAPPEQKAGREHALRYLSLLQAISENLLKLLIGKRTVHMDKGQIVHEMAINQHLADFHSMEDEFRYYCSEQSPEGLLAVIEECRKEIAREQGLFESLLTTFHVAANSPLRPSNMSMPKKSHWRPPKPTSRWGKIMRQAIIACPKSAQHGKKDWIPTAQWIIGHFPGERPPFWKGEAPFNLKNLGADENKKMKSDFQKHITKARAQLKPKIMPKT